MYKIVDRNSGSILNFSPTRTIHWPKFFQSLSLKHTQYNYLLNTETAMPPTCEIPVNNYHTNPKCLVPNLLPKGANFRPILVVHLDDRKEKTDNIHCLFCWKE